MYKRQGQYLNNKSVHLFLANNAWDTLEINLDDSVDIEGLSYIASRFKPEGIKVHLPEVQTIKTVKQLCRIFPNKAGQFRKFFGKGCDLNELL